jgi:hypothetical protein
MDMLKIWSDKELLGEQSVGSLAWRQQRLLLMSFKMGGGLGPL